MEDLFNSDSVYLAKVERFSNWSMDNSLDLNVKKTKEMLIDFRKAPTVIPDLIIDGVKVERVTECKYLRTVLDNKLNFNQTLTLFRKDVSQEYFAFRNEDLLTSVLQFYAFSTGVVLNQFEHFRFCAGLEA